MRERLTVGVFAAIAVGIVALVLLVVVGGTDGERTDCSYLGDYVLGDSIGGRELRGTEVKHPQFLPRRSGTIAVRHVDCHGKSYRSTYARFVGVSPEVAVGYDKNTVLVGRGWLRSIAAFPLRRAFFADRRIYEPLPGRCENRRFARTLRVRVVVSAGVSVRDRQHEFFLQVERGTRVRAPKRFGQPQLRRGDRIAVRGPGCIPRVRDRQGQIAASEITLR